MDVELHEGRADFCVFLEVRGVGDAGEFALEIGGVASAVPGVVEQAVGVVEDVRSDPL